MAVGSSQRAGDKQPQHVLLIDEHGVSVYAPVTSHWSVAHTPGANAQATITQATAGIGKRNVCTGVTITFVAGATAPTAVAREVYLIDGAAAGTVYKFKTTLGCPAVAGVTSGVARTGVWVGSPNTAMTLEFESAGGINTIESVAMEGFIV